MKPIDHQTYLTLRSGAEVLEADSHGEKVLRLTDGNFIKLFRRKRLISSALLWPYAKRFADNAAHLQKLGIACPQVIALYRLNDPLRDLVHYQPLPGQTLRQLRKKPSDCPSDLFHKLGQFIAQLHEQGVYFRSAHLGNIVLSPNGQLGLIDIADLRFKNKALSPALRLRNFQHILRDTEDQKWLNSQRFGCFSEGYLAHSKGLPAKALEQALQH